MNIDDDMIATIVEKINQAFPGRTAVEARCERVIKLGEEAGEAQGAALRLMGMTRRTGDTAELAEELADVVITALTVAQMFGIDMESAIRLKAEKVFARGFRDAAPSVELVDTAMTQLLLPAAALPGERTTVIPRTVPRPHEYVAAWSAQDGTCAHLYMSEGMSSPEHCGRPYRHPVHDAAARCSHLGTFLGERCVDCGQIAGVA